MATVDKNLTFYIGLHGQRTGPYTYAEMARFIQKGTLDPESVVNVDGQSDWLPVPRIPELASLFSAVNTGAGHLPQVDATADGAKVANKWLVAFGALVLIAAAAYLSVHKR